MVSTVVAPSKIRRDRIAIEADLDQRLEALRATRVVVPAESFRAMRVANVNRLAQPLRRDFWVAKVSYFIRGLRVKPVAANSKA